MDDKHFDLLMSEIKRIHVDVKEIRNETGVIKVDLAKFESEIKAKTSFISAAISMIVAVTTIAIQYLKK